MIKTVIRLRNDAVMVFDEAGEQIPEYQGQYHQVRESILYHAPAGTVFNHWFGYSPKPVAMPPQSW
jgi:hypothetical protein